MRVFCYFNIHRRCFSLRDVATGLVIAHANIVRLRDVKLKVSEAGRQRVIREQRKNVHAGIEGTLVGYKDVLGVDDLTDVVEKRRVTYNPYVTPTFVYVDTREPVHYAGDALLAVSQRVPSVYIGE